MAKGFIIGKSIWGTVSYLGAFTPEGNDDPIMSNDITSVMDMAVFMDDLIVDDEDDAIKCLVFKTSDDAEKWINQYSSLYDTLPPCVSCAATVPDSLFIAPVSTCPYSKKKLLKLK